MSSWLNPVRPVEKKDGTIRLCIDFRHLNKLVKKNQYSLPRITDILERLKGQRFFSTLDIKEAYYNMEIRNCDKYKTAFRVGHKLYQWKRMPMGFKNAPGIFQMAIEEALGDSMYGLH
jgi:hypothetical protein